MPDEKLLEQVAGFFDKWVVRLCLRDWMLQWRVVGADELPDDTTGECTAVVTKKIAHIKILHPNEAKSNWLDPYDVEQTVVHELVHLHLSPWSSLLGDEDTGECLLEQAVNVWSRMLIEADRDHPRWRGVQNQQSRAKM